MFELFGLSKEHRWELYYQNDDINIIYDVIKEYNEKNKTTHYRIDTNGRVFVFLDNSNHQLEFMRERYNTNEKCRPRYTCDEYDLGRSKIKKKGRK